MAIPQPSTKLALAGSGNLTHYFPASGDVSAQLLSALKKISQEGISCDYTIPTDGKLFDYGAVNVQTTVPGADSGAAKLVGKVDNAAACGAGGGWYYDVNPPSGVPSKITLCPNSCSPLLSTAGSTLQRSHRLQDHFRSDDSFFRGAPMKSNCLTSAGLLLGAGFVAFACSTTNVPNEMPGAASGGSQGPNGSGGAASGTGGTIKVIVPDASNPISDGSVAFDVGPDACGGVQVTATSKRVNILLVLDKSTSMSDTPTGFSSNKWAALKTALSSALDPVKGGISFGLELYPMSPYDPAPILPTCTNNCCDMRSGAAAIDVPIDLGTITLPQIIDKLGATTPAGGTPTAVALKQALAYFTNGAGKDLQGEKYILLATDGAPNCNGASTFSCDGAHCTFNIDHVTDCTVANCCLNPGANKACVDDTETITQLTALKTAGISTFVIGVPGTELYSGFLDQFAVAGGEINPNAPPNYFAIDPAGGIGKLTAVIKSITTQLIKSCDMQLASTPQDLDLLNVYVDQTVVPQTKTLGEMDGWYLDTSTTPPTIRLQGSTCASVQTNGAQSIEVIFGCPTVFVR